jgi:outer membrane protein TolC
MPAGSQARQILHALAAAGIATALAGCLSPGPPAGDARPRTAITAAEYRPGETGIAVEAAVVPVSGVAADTVTDAVATASGPPGVSSSVDASPPAGDHDLLPLASGFSDQVTVDAAHLDVPAAPGVPIDLASALQITAGQNPQVGFAQQRIQEAYAQLKSAETLWLPSIRAGVSYNKRDGVIQDVAGNMITNSRSSVYTGLGALAVGAGSPAVPGLVMNFHLRDAIFQPRVAAQTLGARQQASRSVSNDMLLETALRYLDLLEAIAVLAVAQETLEHARQLSELTRSFARSGQGLPADADRAMTELSIRQIEVQRANEAVRVASIRLSRILSQRDQSLTLEPQETALVPIELVLPSSQLSELIATGLTNRPELAEARYLVGEAVQRLRRESYAPLVPSVLLGLSYGGNGGSPNSTIKDFDDRVDFDAAVYWEVRNLGLGEKYARGGSRAQQEQARWRQVQVMDQVAAEIAQAHAQVTARLAQIELAESGINAAQDSYRRNAERVHGAQGLPIETLQSIQALDQSRRQYVRAVADYNRAQFQLQHALGWPIQ